MANSVQNRVLTLEGTSVSYTLTRKKVKNINLRISREGTVAVSAPSSVSIRRIEEFLQQKGPWICQALERSAPRSLPEGQHLLCGQPVALPEGIDPDQWLRAQAEELLPQAMEQALTLFADCGFPPPTLKLRKMVSRWGSCIPSRGVITLNTALVGAPVSCQVAVAAHELAHLLVANHSGLFYAALESRLPNYRALAKQLKELGPLLLH